MCAIDVFYCDIVEYTLVGDVQAPLLRVVAPHGSRGQVVSTTFTKPYYIPVSQSDFDTVEIRLSNEVGKSMPFTIGKPALVLHFRRK